MKAPVNTLSATIPAYAQHFLGKTLDLGCLFLVPLHCEEIIRMRKL